jgi:hypothetical protein
MATKIKYSNKPNWKETEVELFSKGFKRILLVALEPNALLLRLKRTRDVLRLPLAIAHDKAANLAALSQSTRKTRSVKRSSFLSFPE